MTVPILRLAEITEDLPPDFDVMRAEAQAEGYRFLERLAADWAAGIMRFDREGERLLAMDLDRELAGIGGLTVEPVVPGALRMRTLLRACPISARRDRAQARRPCSNSPCGPAG